MGGHPLASMVGPVFLEGDRVELRPIEADDRAFIRRTVSDPRVRRSLGPAAGRAWTDPWEAKRPYDGDHFLVTTGGKATGVIGFWPRHEAWGIAQVALAITPKQWDNGFGREALRCLCAYAFEERRLHKLVAPIVEGDEIAIAVFEAAGFVEEGRLRGEAYYEGDPRDVIRFGLLAADWFD